MAPLLAAMTKQSALERTSKMSLLNAEDVDLRSAHRVERINPEPPA
jgi:hypothetical protein